MALKIHAYIKGVGTGYLALVVTNLVGLFLTPFILEHISKEEYAIYFIANDILIWLGIVQLGVSPSFTSLAGQLIGSNNLGKLQNVAGTAWALQLLSAFIIVVIGFIISLFLDHWFKPEQQIEELQLMFLILVVSTALSLSVQIYSGLMIANKQIHVDNLIRIFMLFPSIILTIIFLKNGYNLLGLAFAALATNILKLVVNVWRVKSMLPEFKIKIKSFNKADAKLLLSKGAWFSVGGIAGILIMNLDKIIIGKFVSVAIVTNFIISYKLYALSEKLLGQIVNVSRPYIAQLFGKNNFEKLYNLYHLLTLFSLLVGGMISATIFFVNKYFVTWWVGAEYYIGDEVNLILAINFLLQFAVLPNRALLASTFFRIKEQNITRLAEGVVNLLLSILLVQYLEVKGVILASVIATIILSNIMLNKFCNDIFEQQGIKVDRRMYFSYAVVFVPILIYSILKYLPQFNIVFSVITLLISTCYSFYIMWNALDKASINVGRLFYLSKPQ